MASRYFNQFVGSFRFGLKFVEGTFQVGASGAVVANSFTGGGISASSNLTVQKLGTGLYRLQLADPYYRVVGAHFTTLSPTSVYPSASSGFVSDGNLTVGAAYQILGGTSAQLSPANPSSGTPALAPTSCTNWYTLGLYPGLNPAIGQVFVATSGASQVPGSSAALTGQGLVARIINTNIDAIEVLPGVNTMLAPTSASSGLNGALIHFQTLQTAQASSSLATSGTPYVLANPVQNTWIRYNLWLDNSNRVLYNEATTSN